MALKSPELGLELSSKSSDVNHSRDFGPGLSDEASQSSVVTRNQSKDSVPGLSDEASQSSVVTRNQSKDSVPGLSDETSQSSGLI